MSYFSGRFVRLRLTLKDKSDTSISKTAVLQKHCRWYGGTIAISSKDLQTLLTDDLILPVVLTTYRVVVGVKLWIKPEQRV